MTVANCLSWWDDITYIIYSPPENDSRALILASNLHSMDTKRKQTTSPSATLPSKLRRLDPPSFSLPYTSPVSTSRPPPFQQPLPLLTFSYTPSRVLEFTDSALKYFVDPPRGADLGYAYERWIRRPEARGRLDGLLEAWDKARGGLAEVSVVTWRGVITKYVSYPQYPISCLWLMWA